MHLQARSPVQFTLPDGTHIALAEGETIHTESSYKYAPADGFAPLLIAAGWQPLIALCHPTLGYALYWASAS
jgi:uncharacterized SAM-dependent methyltransferase